MRAPGRQHRILAIDHQLLVDDLGNGDRGAAFICAQRDQISLKLDGTVVDTSTVGGSGFAQHTDGTWTNTSQISTSDICSLASGGSISMATHTLQIVDASGKVLAEGTYTLTP